MGSERPLDKVQHLGADAVENLRCLPSAAMGLVVLRGGRLPRFDSSLRTGANHDLTQVEREAEASDARRLLARSRLPPIRGYACSVLRHRLRGGGCLKQLPQLVFQQFDCLPQGPELRNPDDRDGPVQVKRWGMQYLNGIDRTTPGNEASG